MSLPRAPCECLHRRFMLSEGKPRLWHDRPHLTTAKDPSPHPRIDIPYAEEVIVTATRKLLPVGAPLETAHLLPVALVRAHDTRARGDSDVVVMNLRIDRATWKNAAVGRVPCERANTPVMLIVEGFYPREVVRIPQMHLFARGTYG